MGGGSTWEALAQSQEVMAFLPCFELIFLERALKLHLVVQFHWLLPVIFSAKRRNVPLD